MKKGILVMGVVAIVALLLGFVNKPAETEKSAQNQQILTMRVVEPLAGTKSSITIVDENGDIEIIPLEKLSKDLSVNMPKINNTLNSIADKGYSLISSAGSGDNYVIVITYTFVKN